MEKIILKPQFKELLFRSNEESGIYFDVTSYSGATTQEKNLGHLFIISHIKFGDEDLSYIVSLALSLAKREYYSERSLMEQNQKLAFNKTLQKLNEVLEEFLQNKQLHLNMGLISISGDNIYISRLGKFRISLIRNGQLIDVLNNIELFSKEAENEKKFSNIISGKLQAGDKLFAYYPMRSITSREKQLTAFLAKVNQEEFNQKLIQLAANTSSFSCCGIHIQMEQTKEIPLPRPQTVSASFSHFSNNSPGQQDYYPTQNAKKTETKPQTTDVLNRKQEKSTDTDPGGIRPTGQDTKLQAVRVEERPYIIPAELSISKRSNSLLSLMNYLVKFKKNHRFNARARAKIFFFIAALIILPLILLIGFRNFGSSGETKKRIISSEENLRLIRSYLSQNQVKEARRLLYQTLATISTLEKNKKTDGIKSEISQTLSMVDKKSEEKPKFFADLNVKTSGQTPARAVLISPLANEVSVAIENGVILSVNSEGITETAKFTIPANYLLGSGEFMVLYNHGGEIWSLDQKKERPALYTIKEPVQAIDAVVYEGNLYILTADSVYKYNDAVTGGITGNKWAQNTSDGISIAADGNIYMLTANGVLRKYFKGEKTGEFDLALSPGLGSRIFAFKDRPFIYLADKTNARVYIFDKNNGSLKISYDLSEVGAITDISVSVEGFIWILSSDNKIWLIKS